MIRVARMGIRANGDATGKLFASRINGRFVRGPPRWVARRAGTLSRRLLWPLSWILSRWSQSFSSPT